jgi:four helix bundle protein
LQKITLNPINKALIEQTVRSVTSIGANYCEANEAESKKDFIHKIGICKKEAKETKYWLNLLIKANPSLKEEFLKLWQEAQELLLIFSAIVRTSKNKSSSDIDYLKIR